MNSIEYLSNLIKWQRAIVTVTFFIFFIQSVSAQPCTITTPNLFGTPVDKIVCRGSDAQLGVNGSQTTQQYFFYVTNGATRSIGGPLVGNGNQLSVDANISSASAIGQYFVQTTQGACSATNPGFYVYYGNIDDLSIVAWGGDSVSFNWASSGRSSYVKYEYAVTTESDPFNISDTDTATTYNTSATVTGLTAGTKYYIHVRVFEVYKQPYGGSDGAQVDDQCFSGIPWSSIDFTSCSGSPTVGGISAVNPFFCTGNTTTLTATGGLTYQWYKDGSLINTQGTNPDYLAGSEGSYSVYITSNAGCEGMAYSKFIIERKTKAGVLSGGGNFCMGDEVKLGISKTNINQVYEIRNNGQLVTTLLGIGNAPQSEDTIWYNFNINSPLQAGNYTVTTYNAPCASVSFGSVNVNLLAVGDLNPTTASICNGGSVLITANGGTTYEWFKDGSPLTGTGATYLANVPGVYSVIIHEGACSNPAENTSIITATPPSTSTTNIMICANNLPYTWNGNNYTASGIYTAILIGSNGCDSIATLNLTVKPVANSTTNIAVCPAQLPYVWNSITCNAAGVYNVVLSGSNGCDSIATLNLSVNPVLTSTTNASTCSNQLPYVWNGNNYNATGSYNVTLTSTSGCDSIATLNLTVNPVLTSTTNASTCLNQLPYVWNGNNYNATGSYNVTLTSTSGCDSIATLNLTVNPVLTSTTNASTCLNQLPYVWNGNNYNATGSYNVTLTSTSGCDSIATLNLTVNPVLTSTTNASTCSNQLPYVWNGNNYNVTGTYTVTLTGSNGCDSIATLQLTINPVSTSTTNVSICVNQLPYIWNGNNYNATGSYNVTLTSTSGCDSIATLNLTVNPVLTSTTNASTCTNQLPYVWNGNNYNATGTYTVTLTGSNGCDSLATLQLTVNPVATSTTNVSICANQLPYIWNGNNYNATGTYTATLTGSNGCDSIATLQLTINPVSTSTTNISACANQLPYSWNGNNYSTAGSYTVTLISSKGCDSLAILNLSIKPLPVGNISPANTTICIGSTAILTASGGATYQWYLNNNIINGATLNMYNATLPGEYSVEIIGANGCSGFSSNGSIVEVLKKPVASFVIDRLCQGELTTFSNTTQFVNSGAIKWIWDFGDNTSASTFTATHIFSEPGNFPVTLIAVPDACPQLADTSKLSVTVAEAIQGIKYPDERVLKNSPTSIAARNIGQQYLWQPFSGLNDPTIQKPIVTIESDKLYIIQITTTNGCLVVDTLVVNVFDKTEVFVPSAFTPNGNGKNDQLRPLCVGISSIDFFRVYNRWGEMVYQTKTIGEGWNGQYKNIPQPTGTFTWVFAGKALDGSMIKKSGKSVLIR